MEAQMKHAWEVDRQRDRRRKEGGGADAQGRTWTHKNAEGGATCCYISHGSHVRARVCQSPHQ